MAKSVKVDGTRLQTALKRRGITMRQASQEMGYADSYLSYGCTKAGHLLPSVVIMLEKLYGIKQEEYEVKPEATEEAKPVVPSFDMNELYKTIYTAVFNATKEALNS